MPTLETQIHINAEPAIIWKKLMDFENYPSWNSFICTIEGPQEVGGKLKVHLKPPGSNGMTFRPRILVLEQGKEFRWKGKLGVSGLFDGEHFFILEAVGNGQTNFRHGEVFKGLLVGLLGGLLEKTKMGFELMNSALKAECEKEDAK